MFLKHLDFQNFSAFHQHRCKKKLSRLNPSFACTAVNFCWARYPQWKRWSAATKSRRGTMPTTLPAQTQPFLQIPPPRGFRLLALAPYIHFSSHSVDLVDTDVRGQTTLCSMSRNVRLPRTSPTGRGGACAVHGRCRAAGGGRDGGTHEPDQGERELHRPRRCLSLSCKRRVVLFGSCFAVQFLFSYPFFWRVCVCLFLISRFRADDGQG